VAPGSQRPERVGGPSRAGGSSQRPSGYDPHLSMYPDTTAPMQRGQHAGSTLGNFDGGLDETHQRLHVDQRLPRYAGQEHLTPAQKRNLKTLEKTGMTTHELRNKQTIEQTGMTKSQLQRKRDIEKTGMPTHKLRDKRTIEKTGMTSNQLQNARNIERTGETTNQLKYKGIQDLHRFFQETKGISMKAQLSYKKLVEAARQSGRLSSHAQARTEKQWKTKTREWLLDAGYVTTDTED
jgi:hypothetical protein